MDNIQSEEFKLDIPKMLESLSQIKNTFLILDDLINIDVESKRVPQNILKESSGYTFPNTSYDPDDGYIPIAYKRFYKICDKIWDCSEYIDTAQFAECVQVDDELRKAMDSLEAASKERRRIERYFKKDSDFKELYEITKRTEEKAKGLLKVLIENRIESIFRDDPLENQEFLRKVSKFTSTNNSKKARLS